MNNLTDEQEMLVRQFFLEFQDKKDLFASAPSVHRALLGGCLHLLDYTVVDGKFIGKDQMEGIMRKIGEPAMVKCQWNLDTERLARRLGKEAKDEATNNDTGADQTDSSEQATSAKVRKALFRKDL